MAVVGTHLAKELGDRFPRIDAPVHLSLSPSYSGVGDDAHAEQVQALRSHAAKLCGDGNTSAALGKLREVARIEESAAEVGDVMGTGPGGVSIRIVADAGRNVIAVMATPPPSLRATGEEGFRSWRVVLMSAAGEKLRSAEFGAVEGAEYLLAELEGVEDGDWVLGVSFEEVAE
jgi:hypothetical protein